MTARVLLVDAQNKPLSVENDEVQSEIREQLLFFKGLAITCFGALIGVKPGCELTYEEAMAYQHEVAKLILQAVGAEKIGLAYPGMTFVPPEPRPGETPS